MLWKNNTIPPKRRSYYNSKQQLLQHHQRNRSRSSANNSCSMSSNGSTTATTSTRGRDNRTSSSSSFSSSSNTIMNNYNHHQQYHQEQLSGIKWTGIGIFLCIVLIQFVSLQNTTTADDNAENIDYLSQQLRGMEEQVGGQEGGGGFKYYYDHHLYNYPHHHHHHQPHENHHHQQQHESHHDQGNHDDSQQTTNKQDQLQQQQQEDPKQLQYHDTNNGEGEYVIPNNKNHHKQLIYPHHDEQQQQVQDGGQQPLVKQEPQLSEKEVEEIPGKWICEWSPTSHDDCNELLSRRLPYVNGTTIKTTTTSSSSSLRSKPKSKTTITKPKKQRWLFMGDSTMRRQFSMSNLYEILVGKPYKQSKQQHTSKSSSCGSWKKLNCEIRHSDRCGLDVIFGLEKNPKWRKPSYFPNFEGPVNYGLTHPYCSDCAGCDNEFLHCLPKDQQEEEGLEQKKGGVVVGGSTTCNEKKMVYGGYFMIEFAKDVELQSNRYRTTQENIAWYMADNYNKPELVEEWGKPICVILTGFHDMILLIKAPDHYNIERFVENVEWYLMIMKEQCSHIVWMTNTAPSAENQRNWPQTIELTGKWNQGVKDMIAQNHELLPMTSVVDVFPASLNMPHRQNDHIHMTDAWYRDLGGWFTSLITESGISDEQFMDQ